MHAEWKLGVWLTWLATAFEGIMRYIIIQTVQSAVEPKLDLLVLFNDCHYFGRPSVMTRIVLSRLVFDLPDRAAGI